MNAEQHEWYWRGYNDAKKEKQREFLGLTDVEIDYLLVSTAGENEETHISFARAIEAKLKQKNGYAEEKNT